MHLIRDVLMMLCFLWQTAPFVAKMVADLDGYIVNDVKTNIQANINDNLKRTPQHLLSRKRRYLEFPEGSSFQLVCDLLVGVVDYTNYIAVSMTLALAWELPSKSPFEILKYVKEHLREGTFGDTRNDTVTHIKYVDTKTNFKTFANKITIHQAKPSNNVNYITPPMHQQHYGISQKDYIFAERNNTWKRNDRYYYSKNPNPFKKYSHNLQKLGYSPYTTNYPYRLTNIFEKRSLLTAAKQNIQNQHFRNPQNITETVRNLQTMHRIFPIFGKRTAPSDIYSVNNSHKRYLRNGIKTEKLSKLDRIHVRHHRSTRHKLYYLIEKYLERKKNLNGHSCVLRTLCETGKKSRETQPGSFVGELMRAIFTLPEPLDEDVEKYQIGNKEQRYDNVHTMEADCSIHYHQCEHALWSSHLVA